MHFNLLPLCICTSELVQGFVPVYRIVRDQNCPVHKGLVLQRPSPHRRHMQRLSNAMPLTQHQLESNYPAVVDNGSRHKITEDDLIEARANLWEQGFQP